MYTYTICADVHKIKKAKKTLKLAAAAPMLAAATEISGDQ